MNAPHFERRSSRTQVLEAIKALAEQEMPITGDSIARHTGLKTVTVNDCIKELKERDEIWSPERGIYRPKEREEASQAVILIVLPGGGMKIEKGNVVIEFTPLEWRTQVAPAAAGFCAQTVAIENAHKTMQLFEVVASIKRDYETGKYKTAERNPKQLTIDI